jgi:hypothetical protein
MNETESRWSTGRSVLAVIAGLVTVVALDLGLDATMHATGVYPPMSQKEPMADKLFLLAMGYRICDGLLGGFVAARLAPSRPLRHALILGCIGSVVNLAGAIATWNMNLGPKWYSLALIAVALPCAWLGGKLRERQTNSASAT